MMAQDRYRQYLAALRTDFVKLAKLEFLSPDGGVAFTLDNDAKKRRSRAFLQKGSISCNLQNGKRRQAEVTLANTGGEFEYAVNHIWFGQQIRLSEGLLLRVLDRCREIGAVLMVDECFLPLARGGRGMAPYLTEYPELFLLRAFTKTYAIPGLRLGYGLGAPELMERLMTWGSCWNVSGIAQTAGVACCALPEWPEKGRKLVEAQRPRLIEGLTRLGCQAVPGAANYLLFRLPGTEDLKERLLRRGVLVRSCANYRGLGADWYRVAVRQAVDNERFLRILGAELEE